MEIFLNRQYSENVKYFTTHSIILVDVLSLCGIFTHNFLLHSFIKNIPINIIASVFFFLMMTLILLIVDVFSVFSKYLKMKYTVGNQMFIIPITVILLCLQIFSYIEIKGYYYSFQIIKYVLIVSFAFRLFCILKGKKFVSDLIKMGEAFLILYLVQVVMTDPIVNNYSYSFEVPSIVTDSSVYESKNIVYYTPNYFSPMTLVDKENFSSNEPIFHKYIDYLELFFRYFDFHFLVLSSYVIFSDKTIIPDIDEKVYSLYSILGRYDCYRYVLLLLCTHYIFILITSIGEKWINLIEVTSLFAALYTTSNYRQRKIKYVYIGIVALMTLNLVLQTIITLISLVL